MPEVNLKYTLGVDCINRHQKVRKKIPINLAFTPDEMLMDTLAAPALGWDFFFLLDSSGSMEEPFKQDDTLNKLQGIKQAALGIVPSLTGRDTVTLIHYNTQPAIVLNQIPGDHHQELQQAINSIPNPGGATDFEAVLQMATRYIQASKNPFKRIFFLTDGQHYGAGSIDVARRLNRELGLQGVIVDCMGVGREPDMNFLGELAKEGGGQSSYLQTPAEASTIFASTIDTSRNTLISNARLHLDFPSSSTNIEVFATFPETRYHTPEIQRQQGGHHLKLPPFSISGCSEFVIELDAALDQNQHRASQELCTVHLYYDVPTQGLRDCHMQVNVPLALTEGSPGEMVDSGVEEACTKAYLMKYNAECTAASSRGEWIMVRDLLSTMIKIADQMYLQDDAAIYRKQVERLQRQGVLTQEDLNIIYKVSSSSRGLSGSVNSNQPVNNLF